MSDKMTAAEFTAKVDYEGGIWDALQYGLRAADLTNETQLDIDLARHWERLELAWINAEGIALDDVVPLLDQARDGESANG